MPRTVHYTWQAGISGMKLHIHNVFSLGPDSSMFFLDFWTLHILDLKDDIQLVHTGLAGTKILKILYAGWEIVSALSP